MAELEHVKGFEMHGLWPRREGGEGVIELLEADLQAEIGTMHHRLAVLVGTYRHLVE